MLTKDVITNQAILQICRIPAGLTYDLRRIIIRKTAMQ